MRSEVENQPRAHAVHGENPNDRDIDKERVTSSRILKTIKTKDEKYSALLGLVIAIAALILADVIAMFVVYYFMFMPYYFLVILDAFIMAIVIIPIMYIFSMRPLLIQIRQRRLSEALLQARLRLVEYSTSHGLNDILRYALDEIEIIADSKISFFHFIDPDQKNIILQTWSTNTRKNFCSAAASETHYSLEEAGVWADAIRLKKPIIHNNYDSLENKKGLPEGHAKIIRELVIPIFRNNRLVAALGVGNKPTKYTERDLDTVSTYADFSWDVVEHIQAEIAIQKSEEKFRTLVDWTYDWELWMDPGNNIVYMSPSCERITGYMAQEFIDDPDLITNITHPDDRQMYVEHQKVVHEDIGETITLEYRIITRNGEERWIEHICRSLFNPDGLHLGRRISNRDITERKRIESQVIEQNRKEKILTESIRSLQTDIGRDLHDTLGNHIGFLRMNLEHLSEAQWRDPQQVKNQLQKMSLAANEAYEMIRAMLAILQTDNFTDPFNLFTHYADQIAYRSSLTCSISNQGTLKQLSLHQIRQLFYIFREALGNIEKHAQARHVTCEFIWDEKNLRMIISDDGIGFVPEAIQNSGHYGLKFMRERAELLNGSMIIRSMPGQGTSIIVVVPYEVEAEIVANKPEIVVDGQDE